MLGLTETDLHTYSVSSEMNDEQMTSVYFAIA